MGVGDKARRVARRGESSLRPPLIHHDCSLTGESEENLFIVLSDEGILRVMDNHGTTKTIRILSANVGMVPVRAGLVDIELVCEAAARGNSALGYLGGPVHVGAAFVEETVPVDVGSLVPEVVVDVDHNLVANINVQGRARPLAVDA